MNKLNKPLRLFSDDTAVLITANNNAEHYWEKITWFNENKLYVNAFKTN